MAGGAGKDTDNEQILVALDGEKTEMTSSSMTPRSCGTDTVESWGLEA